MEEKIKNDVLSLIAEALETTTDNLNLESSVGNTDNWDSIHQLMIISSIEEKYNISFSEDTLFELTNIKNILNAVEKALKDK